MIRTTWTDRLRAPQPNWLQLGANLVLAGIWLALYRPVFDYLARVATREDFRTNQLLFVGILLLIVLQVRRGELRLRLDGAPQLRFPALALALGASAGYLLAERYLDVNTLSAALFGLAAYGLLGLWIAPRRWRQGLPVALLLIGVLPIGDHLQTFVGYPLRIVTAGIVRDGLAAAGAPSIGVDTILVFENGISQVDVPCSGIKSLWTGMLFLLAATWIQRKPLNARWLLVAMLFAGLLFVANVARVAALVTVGQVMGLRLAAEMLHVPLGVLAFSVACAAAVFLLDRLTASSSRQSPDATAEALSRPSGSSFASCLRGEVGLPLSKWLPLGLIAAFSLMAAAYAPRPLAAASASPATWQFPAGLSSAPLPLTPRERDWLTQDGAESAERWRFEWRGVSGSMIVVSSRTWRAHHRPERCFEVYGLSSNDSRTHLVSPTFPVRFVSLRDEAGSDLLNASYWFQSAERTTDDYGARIWSDLSAQREPWILVSILFDGPVDPNSANVASLYEAMHDAVALTLARG